MESYLKTFLSLELQLNHDSYVHKINFLFFVIDLKDIPPNYIHCIFFKFDFKTPQLGAQFKKVVIGSFFTEEVTVKMILVELMS